MFFLLAIMLSFSISAYSQDTELLKSVNTLKQNLGVGWIVEWNEQGTGLQRIEKDKEIEIARKGKMVSLTKSDEMFGKPEEIAMMFLRNNATLFQLQSDISDLQVSSVRNQFANQYYVDIQQTYNGLSVIDRGIGVLVDTKKGIEGIYNSYVPNINISTTPLLSEDDVIAIAQEHTLQNRMIVIDKSGKSHPLSFKQKQNPFTEKPKLELGIHVTQNNEPILVYRFNLKALNGQIFTNYLIDANNGQILFSKDTRQYAYTSGSGNIFWPNPVNVLNDTTLTDTFNGTQDSKYAIPLAAYKSAPLNSIMQDIRQVLDPVYGNYLAKAVYTLTGSYVQLDDTMDLPKYYGGTSSGFYLNQGFSMGAITSLISDFNFDRESNVFEHVMVYAVIDANQRYVQSLGFKSTSNRAIKIDPHGHSGADMSGYEPNDTGTGFISFGEGGVDDAEDADIILHEYGHAIQDNQAPKVYQAGCDTESGAMSEGFGDYWQASNTRAISVAHGFDSACYAEWDHVGDTQKVPGSICRRRVDTNKRYADKIGECHADGEIWSSALWEILTKIGNTEATRKIADQLVLQGHNEMAVMYKVNPISPKFSDGGIALIKADKTLRANGTFTKSYKGIICKALKTNRDIVVPGCK